jgi:hypothetical protein
MVFYAGVGSAERMRINGPGDVGIGTSAPAEKLHVNGNIALDTEVLNTPKYINFRANATSAEYGGIKWYNFQWNNTIRATITSGPDGPVASGYLAFSTGISGLDATEKMRIDSSGRVGIGTSSPGQRLTVSGGDTTNFGVNGTTKGIRFDFDATQSTIYGVDNSFFASYQPLRIGGSITQLMYGGLEAMRIDSSGRVGIGTSTVYNAKFHVSAAYTLATGAQIALIENSTTGEPACLGFLAVADNTSGGNQGAIYFDAGATGTTADNKLQFTAAHQSTITPQLTLTGEGNVGIGTASPSLGFLEVSSANGVTLAIKNTTGTTVGTEFCQLTFNNTSNANANFESAKIKAISTNGGANLAHLTFENSGTERARIDSSGRLLVGTSSARGNFRIGVANYEGTVQHESGTQPFFTIVGGSNNAGGPYLMLGHQRSGVVGGNTVSVSGDELGVISFHGSDGTNLISAVRIEAVVDGTPGANDMPGRLVFSTTADGAADPTERMRITNAGLHRIFSSVDGLYVACSATAGTSTVAFACRHTAGGTLDGTSSLLIYTNGNVLNTNNSYGAISDIKLKENITDAASQWNDIKTLQVRKYNFKEGQTHTQIGLVAQEVELVSPGLVTESPDRDEEGNDLGSVTKSVNYSVLYMKAVKALQEAMERIETLEVKVATLEGS